MAINTAGVNVDLDARHEMLLDEKLGDSDLSKFDRVDFMMVV